MSDWTTVCPAEQLAVHEYASVEIDDVPILAIRLPDKAPGEPHYVAIEDQCSHDALPLAGGEIAAERITCPAHGAQFCLKTGAALSAPAYEAIPTFPVRVRAGMLQVRDDRWD